MKYIALVALLALVGCTTAGAPLTQRQKIAEACVGLAAAADTIAVGVENGKISKADGKKAAILYHTTDQFCEPPVDSLSSADYSKLIAAAASLAALTGATK